MKNRRTPGEVIVRHDGLSAMTWRWAGAKRSAGEATRLGALIVLAGVLLAGAAHAETLASGVMGRWGFESEEALLADFASRFPQYRDKGLEGIAERRLSIAEGRFGRCLHIEDGSPKSKGAWNESGLDCDLIVAVMWGEWHKKPHYWGGGAFHGDRGTVAFWTKTDKPQSGIVFLQGSVAWGRKERDLFTVEVSEEGALSAHIRDVRSVYHRVDSEPGLWKNGEWQHLAVVYDQGYGLKLYHNGRLVASNWGEDAWWQTPLPGLFSPFLQESFYDEIVFCNRVLSEAEISDLFEHNAEPAPGPEGDGELDGEARDRLLAAYADWDAVELPRLEAGGSGLGLVQVEPVSCRDQSIPAWWFFDGRYELAWPHSYRLFTFILGDADFHGSTLEMELGPSPSPDYISLEGTLEGVKLLAGAGEGAQEGAPLLEMGDYAPFFFSKRIEAEGVKQMTMPFTKSSGLPEDLEGSARLPLSGNTRIHEMHLWAEGEGPAGRGESGRVSWALSAGPAEPGFEPYAAALDQLAGARARRIIHGTPAAPQPGTVKLGALESVHLASGRVPEEMAVDALELRLMVKPNAPKDTVWVKLRDPGNPSRIWAQTCLEVAFSQTDGFQPISLLLDIVDLMVAPDERLLVEFTSAHGCELAFEGGTDGAFLAAYPAQDRAKALEAYATHEMLPCRMQYMKEYNYRPWRLTGEKPAVGSWQVFGGPYDMAYPPLAVLRHDPDHEEAQTYCEMLFNRNWFGEAEGEKSEGPSGAGGAGEYPGLAGLGGLGGGCLPAERAGRALDCRAAAG